jgi:hypothetical protein
VKREKEQNFLKTPLTLVLSRKGREERIEKILTSPSPLPSPAAGRGNLQGERRDGRKNFKRPPHPCPLPLVEMEEKGREGNKKEFT